jgi:hypothetical protein
VITGSPGSGKTAVLTQLYLLASPAARELALIDALHPQLNVPGIDVMVNARGMDARLLMAEFCRAIDILVPVRRTIEEAFETLLLALAKRDRPFVAIVDALDEAAAPDEAARIIARLAQSSTGAPVRLLVSTRSYLLPQLPDAFIVDLDAPAYQDVHDIAAFVRRLLLVPGSPYCAQPAEVTDRAAQVIAARSGGKFLYASMIAETLATEQSVVDLDKVDELLVPRDIGQLVRADLARLGADEHIAVDLLRALAHGPPTGYTLDEWAAAASQRAGGPYLRQDVEDMFPLLSRFITVQASLTEMRYRLVHAALRDYFLHY